MFNYNIFKMKLVFIIFLKKEYELFNLRYLITFYNTKS